MNEEKQEQFFYKQKQRQNITNNKNINHIFQQNKKKLFQKIKAHLLCPNTIIREKKTISFIKSFHGDLSNKNNIIQSPFRNNNICDTNQNFNNNNLNNDKSFLKKAKIKIKLNKNRKYLVKSNLLNYKIQKIPKYPKYEESSIISPDRLGNTTYLNNINYNFINPNRNSFELSETNASRKNNENSIRNYYYNKTPEINFEILSDHNENLIREESTSNDKLGKNNSINRTNKIINWKKVSYINKLRRKKNISETFSNFHYINIDKFKDNKKKDINLNKISKINTNINYKNKKLIKKRAQMNNINNYKSLNLINNNSIKSDVNDYNTFDNLDKFNKIKQNTSIILPSNIIKDEYYYKYNNKINNNNNDYIKIENYNSDNNVILSLNNENDINYIKTENSVEKKENRIDNYSHKNNYYTITREKKKLILNSPNYNRDIAGNSINTGFNSDILNNSSELNDNKTKRYKKNVNYYYNNNWCNNINNNFNIKYINNSCNYNYTNTNNNVDNIQNSKKGLNAKPNPNLAINAKHNLPSCDYLFKPKKIIYKNPIMNKKKRNSSNSENKKLRNIITSIKYRNKKNESDSWSDLDEKNIILSEVDNDGTINIKVKEMKNSIEKIIRENSTQRRKKNYLYSINPKECLTYVKKNQGTHFSKKKQHNNNIHQIE